MLEALVVAAAAAVVVAVAASDDCGGVFSCEVVVTIETEVGGSLDDSGAGAGAVFVATGAADVGFAIDVDAIGDTTVGHSACTPFPWKNMPIRVFGDVEVPAHAELIKLLSSCSPTTQA